MICILLAGQPADTCSRCLCLSLCLRGSHTHLPQRYKAVQRSMALSAALPAPPCAHSTLLTLKGLLQVLWEAWQPQCCWLEQSLPSWCAGAQGAGP